MRRILAVVLFGGVALAQDNAEMKRIYDEDQKVRENPAKIDWNAVAKADAERRDAVRKLLADGVLHSGADFNRAAFVFQHGSQPGDYLLAHTLAMVAVKKGDQSAIWIAAATLDRYLQAIQQKQVYGTQYGWKNNEPVTQEPYDRSLVSDALRKELNVPPQSEQEKRREKLQAERDGAK